MLNNDRLIDPIDAIDSYSPDAVGWELDGYTIEESPLSDFEDIIINTEGL